MASHSPVDPMITSLCCQQAQTGRNDHNNLCNKLIKGGSISCYFLCYYYAPGKRIEYSLWSRFTSQQFCSKHWNGGQCHVIYPSSRLTSGLLQSHLSCQWLTLGVSSLLKVVREPGHLYDADKELYARIDAAP